MEQLCEDLSYGIAVFGTCESWNGKRVQICESNCTVFGFLVVLVRRAFRFLVAILVLLALAC